MSFVNKLFTFSVILSASMWAHAAAQLQAPVASSDGKNLTYQVSYSGYPTAKPTIRLFLDTNTGPQAGYRYGVTANFMLQNEKLFQYSGANGSWTWTQLKTVTFKNSGSVATWKVALADLGYPSAVNMIAQTPTPEVASSRTSQGYTTKTIGTIQPMSTSKTAVLADVVGAVADGSVVSLECGRTYYGTLDLENKKNVTVQTAGNCAPRAVITPAVRVSGWRQYNGSIYVATFPQEVTQVFVDSQLIGMAHYPDEVKETAWLQPTAMGTDSMDVSGLPSQDLVGARVNYRSYPWEIGSRTVTAFDGKTMKMAVDPDINIRLEGSIFGKFYLEGKLWMLNTPGEWAWADGKLYVWMPDGQWPSGRVHAVTKVNSVINAKGSSNVTIQDVRIVGGKIGVDGSFSDKAGHRSDNLKIINTEIAYSNWSAIYATDALNLTVENTDVISALHSGLYARYASVGTTVKDSRFINVNTVGMHKGSDGSIYLNADMKANVIGNTILNSGKTGIFIGRSRDSLVQYNVVVGACLVHGDCGGIYMISRDKIALNTRVEDNLVNKVNGDPVRPGSTNPERYAIYLDDYATGVIVKNNVITGNDTGLQLHLSFENLIQGNRFEANQQRHILLSEGGGAAGSMYNNKIEGNTFKGPALVYYFALPGNPSQAVTFNPDNKNKYEGYLDLKVTPIVKPEGVLYQ